VRFQSEIACIDLENKSIALTGGEAFSAKALIVATGVKRRKLNVEGEDQFEEKGIIESGKRDAAFVKDKSVCIIGGGDAAFENALILSETAARVMLIHRRKDFRARPEFIKPVNDHPKIEILAETSVRRFIGIERVEKVELENLKTGEVFQKNVEAILIRIGVEPNTDFLRGKLDLDEQGYVKVDQNCETNVKGVYAVGDGANPVAPTVSSAVGMGATAAKAVFARLNSKY
jgi:thioredoxin reductase (NADPH)